MRLFIKQWGPENSILKPILLLHGLGGTSSIWRPIAAGLESSYRVLAPDQRGHGQSLIDSRSEFSALDYAQDVLETLESLGIQKELIVVGHSMGGRTALALSQLRPQVIDQLVIVDIGITSSWGGGVGRPLADFIKTLPESFEDRSSLQSWVRAGCPDPSIAQYLIAVSFFDPERKGYRFPFQHSALIKTIEQAHQTPIASWVENLKKMSFKTTFLHGANSKVWSAADYTDQSKRYGLHGKIEFQSWPDAGHGLPFEKRSQFIQFLAQLAERNP